jgi:O-antigen/teichoic acid export membrane protein
VQALAVVVAAAMYPRLSRAVRGNATNAVAASRLIELTLLAGVIGGGALWLARSAAVMTVFGDGYTTAVPVTALLALAVPALAVNIVAGYVLAAAGRMRDVAVLYAGALTVKVALNVALVPANGAMGTASAMAATEIALAVCMLAILRRRAGARFSARRVLALVPCFAAWAAASALRPPACGVIAAGAYTVVALTFIVISGALPRSDRALLLAAVRGGGGGGGGSGGGAP